MLTGINHLTLSVRHLETNLAFYHQLLGMTLHARWDNGAYLSCCDLWVCLSVEQAPAPAANYTHYAFTVSAQDFAPMVARLKAHPVSQWRENRSEGESFYFCCPDGHHLELHVGDLASRLHACRQQPYCNMVFYPR